MDNEDVSPVFGHLGCFYVLANVINDALNIGVHVFLNYRFVWMYVQVWDVGSYGNSILDFRGIFILFSIVTASIYILTTSPPEFVVCRLFMMVILTNVG